MGKMGTCSAATKIAAAEGDGGSPAGGGARGEECRGDWRWWASDAAVAGAARESARES